MFFILSYRAAGAIVLTWNENTPLTFVDFNEALPLIVHRYVWLKVKAWRWLEYHIVQMQGRRIHTDLTGQKPGKVFNVTLVWRHMQYADHILEKFAHGKDVEVKPISHNFCLNLTIFIGGGQRGYLVIAIRWWQRHRRAAYSLVFQIGCDRRAETLSITPAKENFRIG